jgi:hypothetical protein
MAATQIPTSDEAHFILMPQYSIPCCCWRQGLETTSQEDGSESDCATQQLDAFTEQPHHAQGNLSIGAQIERLEAKGEQVHRTVSLSSAMVSLLCHLPG